VGAAGASGGCALGLAGWTLAGPAGLLAAGACATVAALLTLLMLRTPPGPRPHGAGRPAGPRHDAPYARFRELAGALAWGQVSARHFDHATRPRLERIAAALLLERRGIDTGTADGSAAARTVLGPGPWALVDPSAPRRADAGPPPATLADIERLLDRLEEL
jgi:hypothetical protein